jgi:uncharacterized protein (TIGR00725 family)
MSAIGYANLTTRFCETTTELKKEEMMKKRLIIGVMGGGSVSAAENEAAYRLGGLIAREGWVLLNGGRNAGIMEASAKGAWDQGGLTVGILPDDNAGNASSYVHIPIITGMGAARNCINVLSSDVVVACPGKAGTLSEIALAVKYGKPVIVLDSETGDFFKKYAKNELFFIVRTPEEAIGVIKQITEG